MSKLYTDLAELYHEMYKNMFDYSEDFRDHDVIFKTYKSKKIFEIGCGTGNLAKYYEKAGYDYTGSDISTEMLKIAMDENPNSKFIKKDMRKLGIGPEYDAAFICGRGFTYMTTNDDVMKALKSIYKCLKPGGIFVFDNFDARHMFLNFKKTYFNKSTDPKTGIKYLRYSKKKMLLDGGWTWKWSARYEVRSEDSVEVYEDDSVLRAFLKEEAELFLNLAKLEIMEVIQGDFWFRIVAKK